MHNKVENNLHQSRTTINTFQLLTHFLALSQYLFVLDCIHDDCQWTNGNSVFGGFAQVIVPCGRGDFSSLTSRFEVCETSCAIVKDKQAGPGVVNSSGIKKSSITIFDPFF